MRVDRKNKNFCPYLDPSPLRNPNREVMRRHNQEAYVTTSIWYPFSGSSEKAFSLAPPCSSGETTFPVQYDQLRGSILTRLPSMCKLCSSEVLNDYEISNIPIHYTQNSGSIPPGTIENNTLRRFFENIFQSYYSIMQW